MVAALETSFIPSVRLGDGAFGGVNGCRVEAGPSTVGVRVDESDGGEEIVVDGVGRGDGVDGDHARGVDGGVGDVALSAALFGGK